MKKKFKLGNVLTGLATGVLLGFIVLALFPSLNNYMLLALIIPGLILGYQGYSHPRLTETWGFVEPIAVLFIVIGNGFNSGLFPMNSNESLLFFGSIFVILINLFSGSLRIRSIKKRGKRGLTIAYRTVGRN